MIDKGKVKKILVINLSNIGDAVLTTPVIQALRENFPRAHLAVLVGPRAFAVFKNDRRIDNRIVYDKKIAWKNKLGLVNRLRQDRYDLVVDLRNSVFNIFLGARYRTSIFAQAPKSLTHMKDRHLWKLKSIRMYIDYARAPSVEINEDDSCFVDRIFSKHQIKDKQTIVAVAVGARSLTKRWTKQGFQQLIQRLIKEYNARIILVGDKQDLQLAQEASVGVKEKVINLCGKTTIGQLAYLLSRSNLLVSNDSAPMHLGWAMSTPVVAIFGPTDFNKYAPGGARDAVIRKEMPCAPCEEALCRKGFGLNELLPTFHRLIL